MPETIQWEHLWPPTPTTDFSIESQVQATVLEHTKEYLLRQRLSRGIHKAIRRATVDNLIVRIVSWENRNETGTDPADALELSGSSEFEELEIAEEIVGVCMNCKMLIERTLATESDDFCERSVEDTVTILDDATAHIINGLPLDIRAELAGIICLEHICEVEQLHMMYTIETDGSYEEELHEWMLAKSSGDDEEYDDDDEITVLTQEMLNDDESDDDEDTEPVTDFTTDGAIGLADEDDEPDWQARYEYALLRKFFGDIVNGRLAASDRPR